ncbi:hypothetical protein CRENBAI_001448 [Crenichthys baileyi]|uniref:Uncharacterized protein n=1 Tax=Crenichthys baileyi TaxID=28760 RepID=A0AAV9RNX0_9TELE
MGSEKLGAKSSPRDPSPRLTPIGTTVRRVPTKVGGTGTSSRPKVRDRHQAQRTDRKPGPTSPASPEPAKTSNPNPRAEPTERPTNEPKPPAPARQSSRPSDAPPCARERRWPSKPKGATERPQPTPQRARIPRPQPPKHNHQHLGQPSKNDRAKPQHILPYVHRDTVVFIISPQSQYQNPPKKLRPQLRTAHPPKPRRPLRLLLQTESELRTVRNQNQDKEPESKRPPPPQKKTCSHHNIRTTPRIHKTLDTQVYIAPAPPANPSPRQQNALLEGFNEMRAPGQRIDKPKAPATYPPGPKPPRPSQDHSLEGNTPQEPRATPDLPRSGTTTRPVTYVCRHRPPKSKACSHQMLPPESHQIPIPVEGTAHGTRHASDPNPGTPQMPHTQTPSRIPNNAPQGQSKRSPIPTR